MIAILDNDILVLYSAKANMTNIVQIEDAMCKWLFQIEGKPNAVLLHQGLLLCDRNVFLKSDGEYKLVQELDHKVEYLAEVNDTMIVLTEVKGNRAYIYQLRNTTLYNTNVVASANF